MLAEILLLFFLLSLSALFSGLETAYISMSSVKALALKKRGVKNAALLYSLKENQRRLLITVLIGNNVVNVGASAFAAVFLTNVFGDAGIGIATAVMTFLILTFGEILPKTLFAKYAEKITLFFARPLYLLEMVLLPIILFFEKLSDVCKIDNAKNQVTEDDIQAMIDVGVAGEVIHKKQHQMMRGVFEFDDTRVKEIMTPRVEIFAFDESRTIKSVLKEIVSTGFSRIPVYKESIDHITGYIHIRDLLSPKKLDVQLKAISNKIDVVSSEKIIQELFSDFQRSRTHVAVVVDEFGGTAGIVTMEDILEELVGEIQDENDESEVFITRIKKHSWKVNGDVSVGDINERLHLKIPENGHYTSIGGFLQYRLKNLPRQGETLFDKKLGLLFTVSKMSDNKIGLVHIEKKSDIL